MNVALLLTAIAAVIDLAGGNPKPLATIAFLLVFAKFVADTIEGKEEA